MPAWWPWVQCCQVYLPPDDELAAEITAAGQASFDRVWRMPVIEGYQEQLDSPFADIANIGGPKAGSVTAACFF